MLKPHLVHGIFFFFGILFSLLLFKSADEAVLCGLVYATALGLNLSSHTRPRDLFPLVMLFLFLIVLTQVPVRQFTSSLIYTVRGLILFRALVLCLSEIQASQFPTPQSTLAWIGGLSLSFTATVLLIYSSFKPVTEDALALAHHFVLAPVIILGALSVGLRISQTRKQVS